MEHSTADYLEIFFWNDRDNDDNEDNDDIDAETNVFKIKSPQLLDYAFLSLKVGKSSVNCGR